MNSKNDPYWTVIKPRNDSQRAIDEMNAKMLAFHPALRGEVQHDRELFNAAKDFIEADGSIAGLFERAKHL